MDWLDEGRKTRERKMRKIKNKSRGRKGEDGEGRRLGWGEASCGLEVKHTAAVITFHCRGHTHTHAHCCDRHSLWVLDLSQMVTVFLLWLFFCHVRTKSVFSHLKSWGCSPIRSHGGNISHHWSCILVWTRQDNGKSIMYQITCSHMALCAKKVHKYLSPQTFSGLKVRSNLTLN